MTSDFRTAAGKTDSAQALLEALRAQFENITPAQARAAQSTGAQLIDVREASESEPSHAEHALRIPRGYLELRIEAQADRNQLVLLMCQSGTRALLAAQTLQNLGYRQLKIVSGGFEAWKAAGLPITNSAELGRGSGGSGGARYSRQLRLPEFSDQTQQRFADAKVLLIGAGGLGSPAALYLAAAGVGSGKGKLSIADGDQVELSNLHRQILHRTDFIGMDKTLSASLALRALNAEVNVQRLGRVQAENIDALLPEFDCVIDGSDNFTTRFMLADACVRHQKPLVYGAVLRFEGHCSVFAPFLGRSEEAAPQIPALPCYRCLFPEPPPPENAPNCAEAGVLGVLPGVIGSLQALQAMQLIGKFGSPLLGRLLVFDALTTQFREIRIPADPTCRACGTPGE